MLTSTQAHSEAAQIVAAHNPRNAAVVEWLKKR
ncbi:hypothetical protein ABIE53_004474 [Burkholderia sp. OAS925]|nr:hypothetical protein [Paraburkholderia graminis]